MWFIFAVSLTMASSLRAHEIIPGCEGRSCNCAKAPAAKRAFKLFEKLDRDSKALGEFGAGTPVTLIEQYTEVLNPGKFKVLKVQGSERLLKPGDLVTHRFNTGEGISKVKREGKWIEFPNDRIKLETIVTTSYQVWQELDVRGQHGFTPDQPLFGCAP